MVPEPVTPVTIPDAEPVAIRLKSEASTPVTASLKVTVYSTLDAAVGEGEVEAIDATSGGVTSGIRNICSVAKAPPARAVSTACTLQE